MLAEMRSAIGWKPLTDKQTRLLHEHKRVVFVFTHTSYLDFVPYLMYILDNEDLRRRAVAIVKPSLVKSYPILELYGCMAATPIDVKGGGQVAKIVDALTKKDEFILFISPKGTSRKSDNWRTGFYHIAHKTEAEIIVGGFDYDQKALVITDCFDSNSLSCDETIARCKYGMSEITSLNPENAETEKRCKKRPTFICGSRAMAILVIVILIIVVVLLLLHRLKP